MLRNPTKLFGVALATMAAGGATAATAHADGVTFAVGIDGRAAVDAWLDAPGPDARVELVRGGTVIGKGAPTDDWGDGGGIRTSNLVPGDLLNVYRGATLLGSVPYAGRPMIRQDACAGRTSFTVVRDGDAVIDDAGAFVPSIGGTGNQNLATWTRTDAFATVTLERPLVLGEVAWVQTEAQTQWADGTIAWVGSRRETSVVACPQPPAPPTPPAPPVPPPVVVTDQTPARVAGAVVAAGKQLGALDPARLSRRGRFAVRFAAPAAGTAQLHLTGKAGGRTVAFGSGSAKARKGGSLQVTVKLTKAARTLLKRSKRVNVTLVATFAPAASGVPAAQHATTVTLKRRR